MLNDKISIGAISIKEIFDIPIIIVVNEFIFRKEIFNKSHTVCTTVTISLYETYSELNYALLIFG